MADCENCGAQGCCASQGGCGGCGGSLSLTQEEIDLLRELGEIPFLPVARRADSLTPCRPGQETPLQSQVLACLEKKGLISLDYDLPLKNFSGYGDYPLRGSMALTARGQQVLALMEIQGIQE